MALNASPLLGDTTDTDTTDTDTVTYCSISAVCTHLCGLTVPGDPSGYRPRVLGEKGPRSTKFRLHVVGAISIQTLKVLLPLRTLPFFLWNYFTFSKNYSKHWYKIQIIYASLLPGYIVPACHLITGILFLLKLVAKILYSHFDISEIIWK